MLKMLKRFVGPVFAAVAMSIFVDAGAPQRASADSAPQPDNYGTFLGRTIACSCVSGDRDFIMRVYDAILAEAFGETFARQARGHMKLALREAYDNQVVICRLTCDHETIQFLQEVLDTTVELQAVTEDLAAQEGAKPAASPGDDSVEVAASPTASVDVGVAVAADDDTASSAPAANRRDDDADVVADIGTQSGDDDETRPDGEYGLWQNCYWRPNSPICKDMIDPAFD